MKNKRQAKIVEIISNSNVETQEQLLKALQEAGFSSTQATISRDIKELKLIKEHYGKNETRYAVSEIKDNDDNFRMIFTRSALSVESAMNIVVVKCYAGTANAACIALDNMNMPGIVGTIAGDDTIFTVCKDINATDDVVHSIKSLLKG